MAQHGEEIATILYIYVMVVIIIIKVRSRRGWGDIRKRCCAMPLGEELFSEGGNADFKYNSMESDDDMLDDMLDDMDLDEMLDDAIESVTARRNGRTTIWCL